MRMKRDAVVIGSGAFGASVADHLAQRGWTVALLDRHAIASQTSPRAAGLTRQNASGEAHTRLCMLSVEKITRFSQETGIPIEYFQSGSINIARDDADAARLRGEIQTGQARGLDVHEIDLSDLAQLAPWAKPDGIEAMWYTPTDLYLEPGQIPRGYAQAAEQAGATLLPDTPVTGIEIQNGVIHGLQTADGVIEAGVVVDAAGAWSRLVAEQSGLHIPMVPVRHQLMVTEPLPFVEPEHAICRVMDARVYVRPDRGGLMLGGYETDPVPYAMDALPADFQIGELGLDPDVLDGLAASVKRQFPIFVDAPIREVRGGLPTMTPDNEPLIGPLPGAEGLYVATGCCVGGLSISPAVGQVLSELIIDGNSSIPLKDFRLDRFEGRYPSPEVLYTACVQAYGGHYAEAISS
jgi:glycine/D-amino acid oxidase-like deaminating enzyme